MKQLILFVLVFLSLQLRGQDITGQDFLELKNGTRLYCTVKAYTPDDKVIYIMSDGIERTMDASKLRRVVMAPPPKTKKEYAEKPYNFRERGIYNATNITLGFGKNFSNNDPQLLTGVQHTIGWQFNRLLGAGIGFSYDNYIIIDGDAPTWAVYGEMRGYLSKTRQSAFYTLAAGYGKLMRTDNNEQFMDARYGGYMLQPTIGWRFGASNRVNYVMDVGVRLQKVGYDDENQWSFNRYRITYQRCILRLGVVF